MNLVEQVLNAAIAKFNAKVDSDANLRNELRGVRKVVQVEVEDGEWYHFVLENAHVTALVKGPTQNPDIRVIASSETLRQLWTGELRSMKAIATRRLQVKGSIDDLLRFRKFF
jgi:putative sterol carrier protein